MEDVVDLKSTGATAPSGFDSRRGYHLAVVLLCKNLDDYIVGRFNLAIDGEEDEVWSIVLHKLDWAVFLWTLTHLPSAFMTVVVRGEELLA